MPRPLLEQLEDGVVLGDGGYIVELERRGYVTAGAFTPEVVVKHPLAVRSMYEEMLNAGADVLQAMAFYGSREKLGTVGEADRTFEINRQAAQLAREVAGDRALVAGDLSATWKWAPDSPAARSLVAGMFDEQIEAQEGVDFFIGETFFHLGEALLCLERVKARTRLPAMITLAFRATNVTDDGVTAADARAACATPGPTWWAPTACATRSACCPSPARCATRWTASSPPSRSAFRTSWETPWFTGTPAFPDRMDPLLVTRYEMADFARQAQALGVQFIGACCGAIGSHIREMARALGKLGQDEVWRPDPGAPMSETEHNWDRRGRRAPGQASEVT